VTQFTIEMTFLLPVYRQGTYEAETVEEACKMAVADQNWDSSKNDYDSCRPEYISGIWKGEDAHVGDNIELPAGFPREISMATQLNERELATILASLRYWQREGYMSGGHEHEIASNGGLIEPLFSAEIDDLCERLNTEEEAVR
jgi:hypothetical protein